MITHALPVAGPLATMVGSLPHRDPARAVALVFEALPDVPCWPQLPRRDPAEGMIRQALGAAHDAPVAELEAACQAEPESLTEAAAAGWHAFLAGLTPARLERAAALKGQLAGPLTCAAVLGTDELEPLAALLARKAAWQARELLRFGRPVLIAVDEPALPAEPLSAAQAQALAQVLDAIRAAGATPAVHRCAEGQPAAWPALPSYDAALVGDALASAPALVGLVPTRGSMPDTRPAWLDPARSWLTPACGLAGLEEEDAAARMRRCCKLASL